MLKLTPQQEAIIESVALGTGQPNICGVARAGSAKTTTGKLAFGEVHARHPELKLGGMAFNKIISVALGDAIPFAEVKTSNSFGYGAWLKRLGKGAKPDGRKNFRVLDRLGVSSSEFPDAARALALCKAWGIAPRDGIADPKTMYPDKPETYQTLFSAYNIDVGYHSDPVGVIRGALALSLRIAWDGEIDFDDQLYLPVVYRCALPKYDMFILDEAQDLAPIQREMTRMMLAPGGRLVAMGDDRQAIYGFRGADRESLQKIIEEFSCEIFPLTTSFRCPRTVVLEAQRLVPDIEPWADGVEGKVETVQKTLSVQEIGEMAETHGVAILCRLNAPLTSACLRFIKQGIGATILGADIGKAMIKLIRNTKARTIAELRQRMWAEIQKQIELLSRKTYDTSSAEAMLNDKGECIDALATNFQKDDPVNRLVAMIEKMFSDEMNPIVLSSCHKAKGMEWPHVFILDRHLMPSKWAKTPATLLQEHNLEYVAITRAQETLTFINSDQLV